MGALAAGTLARNVQSQAVAARAQYDLAFQVSPIILQGGLFANLQGGLMPIVGLYGQLSLFQSGAVTQPDQFFARYLPIAGSTLINNQIGAYPFANQQVAANAIISQPLVVSLRMIAPVNQPGGYQTKLATFTALQRTLQAHNVAGGTYIVSTPSFIYNDMLLLGMQDITDGSGKQVQIEWQLDFIQPLLTIGGAAAAQNNLMTRISGGGQINGAPTWTGSSAGASQLTQGLTGAVQNFGGQISQDVNAPATLGTTGD